MGVGSDVSTQKKMIDFLKMKMRSAVDLEDWAQVRILAQLAEEGKKGNWDVIDQLTELQNVLLDEL